MMSLERTFQAKVLNNNRITIDNIVCELESIKRGDFVEVKIKKIKDGKE